MLCLFYLMGYSAIQHLLSRRGDQVNLNDRNSSFYPTYSASQSSSTQSTTPNQPVQPKAQSSAHSTHTTPKKCPPEKQYLMIQRVNLSSWSAQCATQRDAPSRAPKSISGKQIRRAITTCSMLIVRLLMDAALCALIRTASSGSRLSRLYHIRFRMMGLWDSF